MGKYDRDDKDDRDLRHVMQQLSEIPFSGELRSRILNEAARTVEVREFPARSRHKRRFANYSTIAAGLVAVIAVGLFGLHLFGRNPANHTEATDNHVPFQADAKQFGFNRAPVQLKDIRIGTIAGDPTNSDVMASVKNISNHPITESDVFGVLSFSPKGQSVEQENWITFVNGPNQTIAPGQTALWHFHPAGAQLYGPAGKHIVEQPHLSFMSAHLVPPKHANVVWKASSVKVSNVQSEPRDLGDGMQSVLVHARVTDTASKPINLKRSRAVIWFASNSNQSFLSDNSIRFMYHLTPEYAGQSWPTVIQPGQTVVVNFPVISNAKSDFFSRTPHVIVIDANSLLN